MYMNIIYMNIVVQAAGMFLVGSPMCVEVYFFCICDLIYFYFF